MAIHTVNTLTTTAIAMAAGDFLFISQSGALVIEAGDAVSGGSGGSLSATILGTLASGEGDALDVAGSGAIDINIGATGYVGSNADNALEVDAAAILLRNSGTIQADNYAVIFNGLRLTQGLAEITNTGTIIGSLAADFDPTVTGNFFLNNTGTIATPSLLTVLQVTGASNIEVLNSGTIGVPGIEVAILLADGQIEFHNSGEIHGLIDMTGAAEAFFVNTGLITGGVKGSAGEDWFYLTDGTIQGSVSGFSGDDRYFVDTQDLEISEISSGPGDTSFDRVYATVSYALGFGLEGLYLSGLDAVLGYGNTRDNLIDGSVADNLILGRRGDDTLASMNGGKDTLRGGEGNDVVQLGPDTDDSVLAGGGGLDLLQFLITDSILVNLSAGTAGSAAYGSHLISGFESVESGSGNDTLTGSALAETLNGGAGDDRVSGAGGLDVLVGGFGKDTLIGGGQLDTFVLTLAAHSGPGAGRDVITDFNAALEVIDLSAIDAVTGGADNAFTFVGGNGLAGSAGRLRFEQFAVDNLTLVEGDTNGDGLADFQLELTGLLTLTAANFLL